MNFSTVDYSFRVFEVLFRIFLVLVRRSSQLKSSRPTRNRKTQTSPPKEKPSIELARPNPSKYKQKQSKLDSSNSRST